MERKRGKKGKKGEEQIAKYRELLLNIQDKEKKKDRDMELEITWVPGNGFSINPSISRGAVTWTE